MDPEPGRRFRTAGAMLHALDPAARLERGMGAAALAALAKVNLGRRLDPADRTPRNREPFMERAVEIVVQLVVVLMGLWVGTLIVRQIFRQIFPH